MGVRVKCFLEIFPFFPVFGLSAGFPDPYVPPIIPPNLNKAVGFDGQGLELIEGQGISLGPLKQPFKPSQHLAPS